MPGNLAEYNRSYHLKNAKAVRSRHRKHYRNNKEAYYLAVKKYRQKLAEWFEKLKGSGPCIDCEMSYPPYVLDYDHVRGRKILAVSEMLTRGFSKARILEEIAKCELVCSNCHRIRTHKRRTP